MLDIPVIRWGKPYESKDKAEVVHFETGETMATVHQANGGLVKMDMRKGKKARNVLREFKISALIDMCAKAADIFENDTLPCGNGTQSPEEFCKLQSASTGLPENMCLFNMGKNAFALRNMGGILDALTRGLPLDIFTNGYGMEDRGVMVSYQANTNVSGWVLPSNSPGVHTLWLPVIPLQIGLALKPGSSEPWTPYRIYESMVKAGIPAEAFCLYPGPHEVGNAVLDVCERSVIFGGAATVEKYHGNPKVGAHGPGFSKIVLGEDKCDDWEKYLDLMVDSVYVNSGRSCISCSGIWTPRHGAEIADAIAKRIGPVAPKPMNDPEAGLAAFTTKGVAEAMSSQIDDGVKSSAVTDVSEKYRDGESRLVEEERCDFLRPTVLHVTDPDDEMADTEYMFPFVSVVDCPNDQFIKKSGYTLVCTALTDDEEFSRDLIDSTSIDRLNIGEVKTVQLNWLQPHEGNIIDFLFRARAFQTEAPPAH
jgi:acyl-CoA reductase-like NAD-dependent aldehyde dehydrogenase